MYESANDSIVKATELPELQAVASSASFNNSGGRGGWRSGGHSRQGGFGDRNGGRFNERGGGANGQSRNGAFKRPFEQQGMNSSSSQNKRIKFD